MCIYMYVYIRVCVYKYTLIGIFLLWYTKDGYFWAAASWLNLGNPFEKDKDDKLITVLQVLGGLCGSPEP